MEPLVSLLRQDYPNFSYQQGAVARWSPATKTISYVDNAELSAKWSLLHELGHALLDHQSYESDANLLFKEVDAWDKAVGVATRYKLQIPDSYIQDCLDTYRDWLAKRSTCPTCNTIGLQRTQRLYSCLSCHMSWNVSHNQLCRPYRLKKAHKLKSPAA